MRWVASITNKKQKYVGVAVVLGVAIIGVGLIGMSRATTPTASVETEAGVPSAATSRVSDGSASSGAAVQFGRAPLLGAIQPTNTNSELRTAGFGELVISAGWDVVEPTQGVFSTDAITALQTKITAAKAAGLSPSLDIGVQYPPGWIFNVGGGTRLVDQYGDVASSGTNDGNSVANAVTNAAVRTEMATYITYLANHLTGLDSVRVGGLGYNELRYPSGKAGTQSNAYWFYDSSSQAVLPASARGWKPGTGTVAQATAFITTYNNAITDYGVWLTNAAASAFPASVKVEILLPGWGQRPGAVASAANSLLNATPDELNQGLDWIDLLPKLPANDRFVVYSTWADATFGSASNPNPAAFIHSILPAGMLAGGESSGNGVTTDEGMHLMFQDAKLWHWYVANWFFGGQPQTLQQVTAAFTAP
jgi:hypothetical protein